MHSLISKYLNNLYHEADRLNSKNIEFALTKFGPHYKLLDVGCWDGKNTQRWSKAAQAKHVYGIEIVTKAALRAKKRGIRVRIANADTESWRLKANFFDCIISNQVIEHLSDVDTFIKNAHHALKSGGYFITSTNNLSSLHNILSLIFGWAPFDLTNSSRKSLGIGNPLAVHKNESVTRGFTWTHKCVYTQDWLEDWFRLYGFTPIATFGSGFYPFPSILGSLFTKHSAFITIVCKKNDKL